VVVTALLGGTQSLTGGGDSVVGHGNAVSGEHLPGALAPTA
jgi:hypothetical protein